MGGTGKSVLASALARSIETRRAFIDGIFWLDIRRYLGPQSSMEALEQLLVTQGNGAAVHATGAAVEQRLTARIKDKRCLLVLDNVDRVDQLESIVRCVDNTGRVLVTTRNRDLLGEANQVNLKGLDITEASQQLADWLQLPSDDFDDACDTILHICDGMPFAIALSGALIASGVSRSAVATKFTSMDLAALEKRFPEYEYSSILPCLEVSFDALERASGTGVECLESMVIFPAGALIPKQTLVLFWQQKLSLDEATCSFELARLCNFSLVRTEEEPGMVSLHQLVHAYLVQRVPDSIPLHEELLNAYSSIASSDWINGPQDGYYYSNLVYHLLAARGIVPTGNLLVGSPSWMREKIKIEGNALSYLNDVERTLDALDESEPNILLLAQLSAARQIARKGPRSYSEPIIKAMIRLGMVENALEFARANIDPTNRVAQLLVIYKTLEKEGDDKQELIDEIERNSTQIADSDSMQGIHQELVTLLTRAGRLDDALRIWHMLAKNEFLGKDAIKNMLAHRLAKEGRNSEARSIQPDVSNLSFPAFLDNSIDIDTSLRSALRLNDNIERDVALSHIVKLLSQKRQFKRARSVAHEIQRIESRIHSLASITWKPCLKEALDIVRKQKDFIQVSGLIQIATTLDRLNEIKTWPSIQDRLYSWIHRLPTIGRKEAAALIAEAENKIKDMDSYKKSFTLRYLALAQPCRVRKQSQRLLSSAHKAANEIDNPFKKANELAEIADSLVQLSDDPDIIAEGKTLLAEAMTLAETSGDRKANLRARVALSRILVRNQHFDLALKIAQEIPDEYEKERALRHVASVLADIGKPESIEIILAQLPDDYEINDHLAVALARAGEYEAALKMTHEPRDEKTLLRIAHVIFEKGQTRQALDLLYDISNKDATALEHVSLLANIVCSSEELPLRQGLLEKARLIAKGIHSTTYKSMAYADLARAEAHLGDDDVNVRFEQAVELANTKDEQNFITLMGPSPRFTALKRIGERMVDAGLNEMAIALANSLETDSDDESLALNAFLLSTTASHGLLKGTLDEKYSEELFSKALIKAKSARNSLVGPSWQLLGVIHIAKCLAEVGQLRSAFDLLGEAHFTTDPYIFGLVQWAEILEKKREGLSLKIITAVAEIFSWQRPDWKAIVHAIQMGNS
jgi:thioredoxin-like negative regulator of GroEL